jgi:cytochrome c
MIRSHSRLDTLCMYFSSVKSIAALAMLFFGTSSQMATAQSFSFPQTEVQKGQAIAQKNCAACHAIGTQGLSPNKDAPTFRTLAKRYPLDNLQEALAEGIAVGHKGQNMPEFEFDPAAIDQLITYLKSIAEK